jgi:hypothetical protein
MPVPNPTDPVPALPPQAVHTGPDESIGTAARIATQLRNEERVEIDFDPGTAHVLAAPTSSEPILWCGQSAARFGRVAVVVPTSDVRT